MARLSVKDVLKYCYLDDAGEDDDHLYYVKAGYKIAKSHDECLPYISKMEELLMKHFAALNRITYNRHATISVEDLAAELVETDLVGKMSFVMSSS